MPSYKSTLFKRDGTQQVQEFPRFMDGLLWLAVELDAGDGFAIYGEIRLNDELLWRRGLPPPRAPQASPSALSSVTAAIKPSDHPQV